MASNPTGTVHAVLGIGVLEQNSKLIDPTAWVVFAIVKPKVWVAVEPATELEIRSKRFTSKLSAAKI
jgi:hypothetical protein